MLYEFAQYVLTPVPRYVRAMGLLGEVIAIAGRHARCRRDWQQHLDNAHHSIGRAIDQSSGNRHAVVLGSGWLLDVPLAKLASHFEQVTLVDLVFPWSVRWQLYRYPNVRCHTCDVTGYLQALYNARHLDQPPYPTGPGQLDAFVAADLVISLNLLSQLPLVVERYAPNHWRDIPENQMTAIAGTLIDQHLGWLHKCQGAVLLISDTERFLHDGTREVARESLLWGRQLAPADAQWQWHIGPKGEVDRRFDLVHAVRAVFMPAQGGGSTRQRRRFYENNAVL